jgi:hypothetical protein
MTKKTGDFVYFWFYLVLNYYNYQVEEDEIGGACSTNGWEEEHL